MIIAAHRSVARGAAGPVAGIGPGDSIDESSTGT